MSSFELAKNAFLNGLSHLEQNQFLQAEKAFRESLVHAPDRPSTLINLAITLMNLQSLDEAKVFLNKLIATESNNPEALFYLGLIYKNQANPTNAIEYLQKATQLHPDFFDAWLLLADLLDMQQSPLQALSCYESLLAIKNDFLQGWINKALLLSELGRHEEACHAYSQAIAISPDKSDMLYCSLGDALLQSNRHEEAISALKKAITLNSKNSKAHSAHGAALYATGLVEEAYSEYQSALDIDHQDYQTWANKGVALHTLNKHQDALDAYDKALAIKPDYAEAWSNKAITLNDLKRHEEALDAYDKALAIKPDYAEAWSNKAITLNDLKRHEEALDAYDKALAIKPEMEFLLGTRLHIQMQIADWDGFNERLVTLKQKLEQGLNLAPPFPLLSLIEEPKLQQSAAQAWIRSKASANPILGPIPNRMKQNKIRIGYFSADFRAHPVAHLIAGVFEHHNRNFFEVFGFSYGPDTEDPMRARLERSFDQFFDVQNKTDKEVAELVRKFNIDIAIDLTGLTRFSRQGIFAYRAAPIQINYLGYPGTSGANYFDYCIADSTLILEAEKQFFNEKIVFLPNSYQANDNLRKISARKFTRNELGLPENAFVFCCFNNNYKITPEVFEIWMKILHQVENSVLWLFEDNSSAAKNLLVEAGKRNIPSNRIIFAQRIDTPDHLARHRLADLFLDTLPYNAHTTASDALWACLPVLTCTGNAFPGRVATSLLSALELKELITESPANYEKTAIELANNAERLGEIRAKLAKNLKDKPLFDTALMTKNLEIAYAKIHDRYSKGVPAENIYI